MPLPPPMPMPREEVVGDVDAAAAMLPLRRRAAGIAVAPCGRCCSCSHRCAAYAAPDSAPSTAASGSAADGDGATGAGAAGTDAAGTAGTAAATCFHAPKPQA
eukprot:365482-Chlamydomonas_euryale.AAC.9